MISLTPFFQPSPHRNVFLFLAMIFVAALTATTISYAIYPAPVFTWQQLQELQPQELPLYSFERGNLGFTLSGENFLLFERWLGNSIRPNLFALDVYLFFLGLGLAGLLAVISTLSRNWFYIGAMLAAFFFALLRWDLLLIFHSDSRAIALVVIVAALGLLSYFQFYNASATFGNRLFAFLGLLFVLAIIVGNAAAATEPLRLLAVNTLPPAIVLTLIFIIIIAPQLMASFVSLASTSSKTNALRHYLFISVIYLLNLWLAYLNRIGWMEWDYTIPSFMLFIVSTALTIWTIRQRMPLYENIFGSESVLVFFMLSLATIGVSVYAFFLSSANDISLLSLNDLILYSHLGFGMMFLVYTAANFLGVFEQNLLVERVLYKPNSMPYFTFRLAGSIATLAFVFYNTWFTHVNHFTSGYYNALADIHNGNANEKAGTFYRRAHFYAPYNQYASTVLAEWEAGDLNYPGQKKYSLDANSFHPTEFTLLNTDQLYLASGNAYADIQLLRRAKNLFPHSGVIKNNLGLALSRVGSTDSAAFYFREALKDHRTKNSAELNLFGLLAKSGKPQNLDSLQDVWPDAPVAVKSNALAIANHTGRQLQTAVELPKDSVFDLFYAALVANFLTNQIARPDTAFIRSAVAMAKKPQNLSYRHLVLPPAAQALYAAGHVNSAVQLLQEAIFLGTHPANDNYTIGVMAMDQGKHDVAISYFLYALHYNSAPAALANAVCLAEEGRIDEAIVAWDTISQRKDTTLRELGESMKRVLAAPPSWFENLDETERLYYALYRIPLSDSLLFNKLVGQIRNEDLRAKAYLNRAREYYHVDDVKMAMGQFTHLQGLHLTDTELFAEIKYFEMRLLAGQGRVEELWKLIDQGILFGPYHQSEKVYYEGLKSWAAGDTVTARRQFDWLARHNWYFDEGVVAAAQIHFNNPRLAYRFLSEALQVNPRSVRILKAYIPVALVRGFDQYASDALLTLRDVLPPTAFRQYVNENQFSALLPQ